MDKKEQIIELIEKIEELNYHYYTLDSPLVSDGEYDKLYDKLKALEKESGYRPNNSPTQKVGGEVLEKFEKHFHISRLYSQDKAQTYEDLNDWIKRVGRLRKAYNDSHKDSLPEIEFIMEYKFDGLTINLTYENGILKNASTRGNGIVGEEISAQAKTIKSIPLNIDEKSILEIQGEALMPLSELEKYNKKNDIQLKNARNAAAGAIRNLNPNETRKRNLTAFFYNISTTDLDFASEEDMLEFLKIENFNVHSYHKKVKSYDEIISELQKIEEERKTLDILTDGVVIKINDKKTQKALGYTNKFPRWSVAFKFEAEEYTTTLLDVVRNVGRTGKVTPSALLEPVDFSGVTVSRATLNNYDDIERKKIKIGSKVFIRRSNDVIPEILGVVDEDQPDTKVIEKPTYCPYCGSELIEGNVHIMCPNSISCTPQLLARMEHFASRNAMDIEGLSEKTIAQLMNELNIKDIYEIYDLTYEDLINLDRFGDKKTKNLLNSIEDSKDRDLNRFIYAIGIPNVGERTARDLANRFESFDNLRNANVDQLVDIEDIGLIIAENIVEFFHDDNINGAIDTLLSKGIKINEKVNDNVSNKLDGKTFVITGTINNYKRDDIKELIENNGGIVTTSVSKNTDVLICGQKAGSKLTKARDLGIEIYENEKLYEFLSQLEGK
ncbi:MULTISPECIES: NAD-dependent DNA ligase LigA [Anaerococcus]|uniref:NAD-dependent DNA ligase LigA n=1 Tax=Anaerococcus TaxID=165779 RepID=UPI00258BFDBF|nr:NAD-dependent DNA ligase LigA [Anaerococcus sp.]MDU1828990.1 NAD-dependent DNA ligase LigA [Anaerococcus sp.]MDU1863987.1 NAD-dependent DNA ligase LigA [Anaerococcus sp.]MDU3211345.1 NAD-dependent DNA ligase LigA [Anaerococcus sp.]